MCNHFARGKGKEIDVERTKIRAIDSRIKNVIKKKKEKYKQENLGRRVCCDKNGNARKG